MALDNNETDAREKRSIETASGTTSPDNAKSGNGAYLIAAVVVVVCLTLGACASGCMRLVGLAFHEELGSNGSAPYEDDVYFDEYPDGYENYEDYDYGPWGWEDEVVDEQGPQGGESEMVEVKDVMGAELSATHDTIDSLLYASDYANAEGTVRTTIREMVLIDRDASTELANLLHGVAWNDKDQGEALEKAATLAKEAEESLRAVALPAIEGNNAAEVSGGLERGKSAAIARWQAIAAQIELFQKADEVSYGEVAKTDDAVAQASLNAANEFKEALQHSANR